MLPSLSHLAPVGMRIIDLPPEIIAYILKQYKRGEFDVICQSISQYCTATRCSAEVWAAVLDVIQEQEDLPFEKPDGMDARFYIRYVCILVTATSSNDAMTMHGSSALRMLYEIGITSSISWLITRWNAHIETTPLQRNLDAGYDAYDSYDVNYDVGYLQLVTDVKVVERLPLSRGERGGVFEGRLQYTDVPAPFRGFWLSDITHKKNSCFGIYDDGGDIELAYGDEEHHEFFWALKPTSVQLIELRNALDYLTWKLMNVSFPGEEEDTVFDWYRLDDETRASVDVWCTEANLPNFVEHMRPLKDMKFFHLDKPFGPAFFTWLSGVDTNEGVDNQIDAFMQFRATDHEVMVLYEVLVAHKPSAWEYPV